MLVRTVVRPSQIEGLGIFADEEIVEGQAVWQFTPGLDLIVERRLLKGLSEAAYQQFIKYAYISKKTGEYILCFDDARFFNHHGAPNISCKPSPQAIAEEDVCIANRTIHRGEELTCNYREFDAGPAEAFVEAA